MKCSGSYVDIYSHKAIVMLLQANEIIVLGNCFYHTEIGLMRPVQYFFFLEQDILGLRLV